MNDVEANSSQLQRRSIVDDHLKDLIHELGNAINESLSDSDKIADVIGAIRETGHDVILVIEATIGFNKLEKNTTDEITSDSSHPPAALIFTDQDQAFLKSLKINIEE